MHEPPRGFEASEFAQRTARAQALMAEAGIGVLLLMQEAEVRYFSGFHTLFWQSPTRPWFLLVPAQGKPIAVVPEIGAALMRSTWLDDVRTWSAPCPEDDGVSLLIEALRPWLSGGARLGVMRGHETSLRMPLADWERVLAALPSACMCDATALVQGLRMVKSAAEIDKLRHICAIGGRSFARLPEWARAGDPLDAVFRAFRREGLAQGADDVPYLVGGAGPGGYVDVISPPSARPLQDGDVLMLDTGMTWDGYWCDFDRNWAIGHAPDAARRAYDTLWQATEAGAAAARVGQRCCDVFAAMARAIHGDRPEVGAIGRMGHGLGMQLTEQPSHAAFDTTPLQANMVITLEPAMAYGEGLMMVHEENIVVREDGIEWLSPRAAPELPVLPN